MDRRTPVMDGKEEFEIDENGFMEFLPETE